MQTQTLAGGFADAPIDAAHAFRGLMTAMARPGTLCRVTGVQPPTPLSVAAGAVLLTLCDPETPLFLGAGHDSATLRDWITFHTGAPLVGPEAAMFALGHWQDLSAQPFPLGTPDYPDRSATLIVEMPVLKAEGTMLRGPGIRDTAQLSLPETDAFHVNARLFPLGLDFILTCGDHLAGVPRTTRIV